MTNLRNFVPRNQKTKVKIKVSKLWIFIFFLLLNEAIIALRNIHYELTINDTAAIAQDLLSACETKEKMDEINITLKQTGRTSGNAGFPLYRDNNDLSQRYLAFLELLNLAYETCELEKKEEKLVRSRNPSNVDEVTLIGILIQNNRTKIDERIALGEEGKERFNYPLNASLYPGVEIHYISRIVFGSLSVVTLGWKLRHLCIKFVRFVVRVSVKLINTF
jgi:hypothetical protein